MGTTSSPWWRIHARASCEDVHPCFSANFSIREYKSLFLSKFSPCNLGCIAWWKRDVGEQWTMPTVIRNKGLIPYQKTVCRYTFYDSLASKKSTTKGTVWYYSNSKFPASIVTPNCQSHVMKNHEGDQRALSREMKERARSCIHNSKGSNSSKYE